MSKVSVARPKSTHIARGKTGRYKKIHRRARVLKWCNNLIYKHSK